MLITKNVLTSWLGFLIIAIIQTCHSYRILGLFPLNARSHFIMAESLMKGLAYRGHEVDVVSHYPQRVKIANYTDISLKGTLPDSTSNVSVAFVQSYSSVSVKRMAYASGLAACSLLGQPTIQNILRNPPTNPPYDVIVVEVFVSPCYLAFGPHLKVPIVGISPLKDWRSESLGNPPSTAFVPNVFNGFSQNMNFWERLVNTLEHHVYSKQLDYYTEEQNELVRRHVGPGFPDVSQLYDDLALLLVNSHHSMERIRPTGPNVVEVAGLHLHEESSPLDLELAIWLNQSDFGCVYFTMGSMVKIESLPRERLDALYVAFRKLQPIRVLMKVGNVDELPVGLPDNVKTRSWFPQHEILKHKNVRVFMSHGGIFGIQEAIYFGVPLIGIPLFGDQRSNVDTFARSKVLYPINFDDLTADNVERAVRTVLGDPSYSEGIKKLRKVFLDRPMKPLDTAIFWIEYVVRNGNVLRSPAIDLKWWERSLLDVYAFIVLSIFLSIYVFLVIIPRKCYHCYVGQREKSAHGDITSFSRGNETIIKKRE